MPAVFATILTSLATKLLTEKFLMRLVILGLEYAAGRTTNTVDDEVVAAVKEAYYGPEVK
ncbi:MULTISPECIES: hypothetical protein [unclassified Marinobacter]|uniref:hypothetical protein n=1 Tax=unclassified Marinobacter TaxID=83889 RepID=UPI001268380E|nr:MULTISPECIES: hypothetical protein [unclassified Marinobacter]QFS87583.1 hypothetical protein FIV08_12190 [Marinobacter sp. THAF197a]QFT51368.1 hypothetical protein FIU96_12105 [Marinobacter sp. THAF39]